MKNVFDLEIQNSAIEGKIVAGMERLSQVFRILLWEKAKKHNLSPIQIQLLIFIKNNYKDVIDEINLNCKYDINVEKKLHKIIEEFKKLR